MKTEDYRFVAMIHGSYLFGPTNLFREIQNFLCEKKDPEWETRYSSQGERPDPSREIELPEELERKFAHCLKWAKGRNDPERIMRVFYKDTIRRDYSGLFVVIGRSSGRMVLVTDACKRHIDVANRYWEIIGNKKEKMRACGGGRLHMIRKEKRILFCGASGSFGPFCGLLVERLAKKAMKAEGFRDYELEIRDGNISRLPYYRY